MKYEKITREFLADFYTPVSLFLRIRQKYPQSLLLESSDYSSREDSQSFICFQPMESIVLNSNTLSIRKFDEIHEESINRDKLVDRFSDFVSSIDVGEERNSSHIFGYSCYDLVQYFENINFDTSKPGDHIPLMRYDFFRFVLRFDHFHEKILLTEYVPIGEESQFDRIMQIIRYQHTPEFMFNLNGDESSNSSSEEFMESVKMAKHHLQRGDIFQIVLSRSFSQKYNGDEFMVYRHLRSVNPSPYLYFFDYGDFKLFGSSPEAQLVLKNGLAEIHPIAGTVRRTGDYKEDTRQAKRLADDPKENAEHVMLVDLARNDLSRHGHDVRVKKYKEIQFFSHVIHLTSVVQASLKNEKKSFRLFGDTFPAGTLSGAPKYKAMQLIDSFEKTRRGFYGGAIGMMGLNGDINHAILIRSFLASGNTLRYQAGAGVVIDSKPENELQEVNNKLAALKAAIKMAANNE